MAYQPLYATIGDTNATRHTTSLRSRVNWVNFWLNSHFGEVMTVSCSATERADYSRVSHCKSKLNEWKEKKNKNKIQQWKVKLKEAELEYKEDKKKERVDVYVSLKADPRFKIKVVKDKRRR